MDKFLEKRYKLIIASICILGILIRGIYITKNKIGENQYDSKIWSLYDLEDYEEEQSILSEVREKLLEADFEEKEKFPGVPQEIFPFLQKPVSAQPKDYLPMWQVQHPQWKYCYILRRHYKHRFPILYYADTSGKES